MMFYSLGVTAFKFFLPIYILVGIYLIYTNRVKVSNEFEYQWLALISPCFISFLIASLNYGLILFIIVFITMVIISGIYFFYFNFLKRIYELKHHFFVLISLITLIILSFVITGKINKFILVPYIPTLIFTCIYLICRYTINKNKEIEKMNIQDL
jgi:uncharacterized membrane protein